MSQRIKPTKWNVRAAKTQIILGIPKSLISKPHCDPHNELYIMN